MPILSLSMADFQATVHPWNQELWQSLTAESVRSNHAFLFTGENGLGKRSLGLALAHFLMTEPHSQSESLFKAASHPDLHIVMPEFEAKEDWLGQTAQRYFDKHSGKPKKQIIIDQIRRLNEALETHPHISKIRIICLFSCEKMNRNASNALLKKLEEPPAQTLFILVSDELARIPATIRSRCSLVNFRAPSFDSAKSWLVQQNVIPEDDLDTYLSMSNNHPLAAIDLYQSDYISVLKSVLGDVNNLWMRKTDATQAAKNWFDQSGIVAIDILQKLSADILKFTLTSSPEQVFFPVQKTWVAKTAPKLSREKLLELIDELSRAKSLLNTTVDELLVLETIGVKVSRLPA